MSRAETADAVAPPRTPAATRPRGGLLGAPGILWRFGRPHTVIGTSLGILGIYLIAAAELRDSDPFTAPGDLLWVLLAGFCVNVFIVGINQLEDVDIDRVNKPFLPIAAGELSIPAARAIVIACAVIPLALALTQGGVELVCVGAALAIGFAYSSPPLRLKRFPAVAALSITVVRTLVLNLGVWLHFRDGLGVDGDVGVSPAVWALVAVTLPFSFAIAVLKDLPDVEGDRQYGIETYSVRRGIRPVLRVGLAVLTAAYLGMAIGGALLLDAANAPILIAGHLAALALLWTWALRIDEADNASITRFYQGVWRLFFLEYLIVPLAYLIGS